MTFSDLKIKALEASLNSRLDMVWTHGMLKRKPTGGIEGLFERRIAPEVVERVPSTESYRPPEHESSEEIMNQEGEWPGARRRSFLAIIVLSLLFNLGIPPLATPLLLQQFGQEIAGMIINGVVILTIIFVICIPLQRLVNLGMSRWWFLANFVPILSLWIGYRCFACPAGYAYHKKLDGIGIFLAIIYWLSVVVVLLMVATFIALLMGALESPELQRKLQEIMQKAAESKK